MMHDLLLHSRVFLPKISVAIAILLCAWLVAKILTKLVSRLGQRQNHHQQALCLLIGRTITTAVVFVGIICALGTLGINVTALVTSLGLAGFAVGFALKDALSNVCAGFMLLLYQPFTLDDTLTIASVTGTVTDINLRYTTLQTDDKHIMVPNNTVLNSVVHKHH